MCVSFLSYTCQKTFALKTTLQCIPHRFLRFRLHSSVVSSVFLSVQFLVIFCYFVSIRLLCCLYHQSQVCYMEIIFCMRDGVQHPMSFVEAVRKKAKLKELSNNIGGCTNFLRKRRQSLQLCGFFKKLRASQKLCEAEVIPLCI